MSKSTDPRSIAVQVLVQVSVHGRALDEALSGAQLERLDPRDQGLVKELCFGSLRWYWRLDALLGLLLRKPLKRKDANVYCTLLIGSYQLLYMRTPAHAAIHATVEVTAALKKPWARGLVNGVLRRVQRDQQTLLDQIDDQPVARYAHPQWLLQRLEQAWPGHWQAIAEANNQHPPMSLRVNRLQGSREDYLATLAAAGIEASASRFAANGITLSKPQPPEQLPGFGSGRCSVQDIAAQLCAGLLQPRPGQRLLDACAAPGGKTGALLEAEPGLAELVALDRVGARLGRLRDNLDRLGLLPATEPASPDPAAGGNAGSNANIDPGATVTVIDGDARQPDDWWDGQPFDRILLDAPCSGSGVIRRHPDIKLLRRDADIDALAARQADILASLWPLLACEGILLYVTCSLLPEENHAVVSDFLTSTPDARALPLALGHGHACPIGQQILPGEDGMDGFYFALLGKA